MQNILNIPAILCGVLVICLICTGCVANEQGGDRTEAIAELLSTQDDSSSDSVNKQTAWIKAPMTDVTTGEQFSIQNLAAEGKPVIISSFAVWCPGCSMQLLEATKLITAHPDDYVFVAIDVDPNENAAKVKNHMEKNNFKGYFTAAPLDVTRSLVAAYGPGFALEIPQTIIICGKTASHLGSGVYDARTLEKAAKELCR